jgi:ribose transport system permease protein
VGIKVNRVALGLYVATGLAVALGAIIQISELDSGPADVSEGFEIQVLTAVLLGGVAFTGGRGSLIGIVLGALFINTLANGFVQWGLTADEVRLTNGLVLVGAAGLQALAAWLAGRRGSSLLAAIRRPPPGAQQVRR